MKVTGPVGVTLQFEIDGIGYQVADGTVTPEIPDGLVPRRLYALGFENNPTHPTPASAVTRPVPVLAPETQTQE